VTSPGDIRCRQDDAEGLLQEIIRRDKIIDALAYQVERNLNDQNRDYGLLQTTFVLEDQIRQRTEELTATLEALGEVSTRATAARLQLETAVENISDGFALFDPQDRILLCNEAFRRLWPQLQACRSGNERCEVRLPSGQALQIREHRMADGCLVGIYSDVTDLKAEEAHLREQELARKSRLLQSTLDTIDQGIAVFDADEKLVAWNLRYFELLEMPVALARPECRLEPALL
jgi:two-component system, sensor histidine kinase